MDIDKLFDFSAADALEEIRKLERTNVEIGSFLWYNSYKKFNKEEIMNISISEFWSKYFDSYDNGYLNKEPNYAAMSIPVSDLLAYFNEDIEKELIYCSVFRNFALVKKKNWFKIVGLDNNWVIYDDIKDEFNCKGYFKMSDMLYKMLQIVRQHHIDFFKNYEHCQDGDHGDYCVERWVMAEFIIRNADKYGIEYYYLESSKNDIGIYNIKKKWI